MPPSRSRKDSYNTSSGDDAITPLPSPPENKTKRKRQSQSCDACRARKVRCARENPEEPAGKCKHCVTLGIPCTYEYQPKKRGPPNLYLRRLQEAQAAASAAKNDSSTTDTESSPASAIGSGVSTVSTSPSVTSLMSPSVGPMSPNGGVPKSPFSIESMPMLPTIPVIPAVTIPPSRYPIAADTYNSWAGSPPDTLSTRSLSAPRDDPYSSPSDYGGYQMYNWNLPGHQQQQHRHRSESMVFSQRTSLSAFYHPNSLESIAPRDTIQLVIALFFDFVYPLTPCVHKPSFMADLHARREERDPLFFALVMSLVASTLVQVPRSYLPMERGVVKNLAKTCHEASRLISVATYDPPTSMHVVVRYFDCVYHFCDGHDATQHAAFGEAAHIAVTLRLHEEQAYEGLDPIESEIRRRIFWLLFGADKSMSILLGRPICLRDEDCTVHFPKELDDEYITSSAYLPQPQGKTALVSGLNYISRIFALLGEILVRIRVDKRSPPQGQFATARLEEVQSLHQRIMSALSHAPEALRLKPFSSMGVVNSGITDFADSTFSRQATFAEVKDFFENPLASRANALNPFLVMQGNLYVTQQLVRFVIEQYRDELIMSLQGTLDDLQVAEDREAIASALLNILHSIPIQSIATNGPSLVHKTRFVASTLLDAVRKGDSVRAARAHSYLWDFLSILSEIERNYLLDDDRDGSSSGDGMLFG